MRKLLLLSFLFFVLILPSRTYATDTTPTPDPNATTAPQDCSVNSVSCTVLVNGPYPYDSCNSDCTNTKYACSYYDKNCIDNGDGSQYCTGTCTPSGGTPTNAPINPCPTDNGVCTKIPTALGSIDVGSPTNFIANAFAILLSIAGAVAITIIILSGYRIMISQGNPEQLKGAREALTSAIIGLLFMIFSVAILQIIGVNILHIPSFMPGATSVNSTTNSGGNTNPSTGGGNNTGGSSGGSNDGGGGIIIAPGGGI